MRKTGVKMLEVGQRVSHSTAVDYLAKLATTLALVPSEELDRAIELLLDARAAQRRIYVMCNGGSAATPRHPLCAPV